MNSLKDHLNSKYEIESEDFDYTEIILDCTDIVATQDRDEHRWYFIDTHIFKESIEGVERYFAFQWAVMKNEGGDPSDAGFEKIDIDKDVWEVYPKEVTSVTYE